MTEEQKEAYLQERRERRRQKQQRQDGRKNKSTDKPEQALLAQAALAGDAPAQTALMETFWAGLANRLFGSWSTDEAQSRGDQ